jgi:hypothetical protein
LASRVDPALTKRALAALKRAADKAKASPEGLSDWEEEFLGSVEERLNTYGSAFVDPDKGAMNAPLSLRQGLKVRQIGKKGEDKVSPKAGKLPAGDSPRPKKPAKPMQRKTAMKSTGFKSKGKT